MRLLQWDPIDEIAQLRESMDRLMTDFWGKRPRMLEPVTHMPALDVFAEGNEVVVRAEVPGLNPKEIDVSLADHVLTIKGKFAEEKEVKEQEYYLCEIRRGSLVRSVTLPVEVEAQKAKALFRNGILEIRVPKAYAAKPSSVKVRVTEAPL